MKRQIPGGEPRILPLVGHREHVVVVDVNPGPIAAQQALGRRRRHGRIALQPLFHHVVIKLLAPQQAGEGLALHHARVVGQADAARSCRNPPPPRCDRETPDENRAAGALARVQAKVQHFGSAGLQIDAIHAAGLGARFIRIHGTYARPGSGSGETNPCYMVARCRTPTTAWCCFRSR